MSNFIHKTFEEQLAILEKRNMKISIKDKAKRTLQVVPYYKLKEFAHPFLDKEKEEIDYKGIPFEVIISRYYQDKNLRISLMHAIEDIEVALQTQISYVLGKDGYGSYGYLHFYNWCNRGEYCTHYLTLKEKDFKKQLRTALHKNKSDEIASKMEMDGKKYPPVWLAVTLLTFGQLVSMLELMSNKNLSIISQAYQCTNIELVSWLKCLNLIRNICAHNSNIVDVKLKTMPVLRDEWKGWLYEYQRNVFSNRVAIPVVLTHYFIKRINPNYKFDDIAISIKRLIKNDNHTANYFGFASPKTIEEMCPVISDTPRNKRRRKKKTNTPKMLNKVY